MTINSFLNEVKSQLTSLKPSTKVGSYTYLGINKKDGYGSPGGRWTPKKFPAFEFYKGEKTFLLRIVPDYDKIVIEAVHLSNMLINYTLNADNFVETEGKVKLLENYAMTVIHRRSFEEVKNAMIGSGMTNNIILEQTANKLNLDNILDSLFAWADYREKAKAKIRGNNDIVKELIQNNQEINTKTDTNKIMATLNQILFGPPGTGKTYNSINKALELINDNEVKKLNWSDRVAVKKLFDAKIKEGQIVFTTFHQSMSYEDFIEGIKPLKPLTDDKFVKYDIQPGIFYNICEAAKSNFQNSKSENKGKLSFEEVFEKFKEDWERNPEMKFPLKTHGYDFTIIGFTNTSIQFRKASGGTGHTLSIGTLKEIYYGKEFGFKSGVGIYYPAVLKKVQSFQRDKSAEVLLKNYVLIIDEINRGNVSQIFGELITLIEEDKRLGKEEALEAILTYSKEKFNVPPNLYIIGTMNTADRSVEALDAALRRRFSFEEMQPKPELVSPQRKIWELWWSYSHLDWDEEPYVTKEKNLYKLLGIENDFDPNEIIWNKMDKEGKDEKQISYFNDVPIIGINLETVLRTINQRIEKLLDKDHQIGHSYFMSVNSIEELKWAFQYQIIPLLQEYFFGDYGKIGMVLGKGFVRKKEWDNKENSFAEFNSESSDDFDERDIFEIINYTNPANSYNLKIKKDKEERTMQMSFEKAIKLLMKQEIE